MTDENMEQIYNLYIIYACLRNEYVAVGHEYSTMSSVPSLLHLARGNRQLPRSPVLPRSANTSADSPNQ